MGLKRSRDEDEDDTDMFYSIHPMATKPPMQPDATAGSKKQRMTAPNAWDAKARDEDAWSSLKNYEDAASSSRGALLTRMSPPLSKQSMNGDEDEDNDMAYDPDEIVIESDEDHDNGHAETETRASASSLKSDSNGGDTTLSSMNALLHELHASRKNALPRTQPSFYSHPPSSPAPAPSPPPSTRHLGRASHPNHPAIPSPLSRPPSYQKDGQLVDVHGRHSITEETLPSPVNVADEKAGVSARYEDTNRLLGSLFLQRRRQVAPDPEDEEL